MVGSNLTPILELLQNMSPLFWTTLGAITGALLTGWLKYTMERKNRLLRAYASLIGKRDTIVQTYVGLISISLQHAVNTGLKQDAYNIAKGDIEKAKEYIEQAEKIDKTNEYNETILLEKEKFLIDQKDEFWKIIGTINGIVNTEAVNELIDDIRKEKDRLEKYQSNLVEEFSKGLSENYRETIPYIETYQHCLDTTQGLMCINTKNRKVAIIPLWRERKNPEIICESEKLGNKIDLLINYIRDNEINKPLFWFGR